MQELDFSGSDFVFIDPNYLNCVLAAGDGSDLPSLRMWCATLPEHSYGRIFIEADASAAREPLPVPAGVGVTWLPAGSAGAAPGTALARAVDAWLDEWLRADPLSGRNVLVWPGARSHQHMREFWSQTEDELAQIWNASLEWRMQQ